ncbi:MAG: bifunctional demethylmenaquinone methyltransferase/2-methoxy-6-polyprenyl-1,4-benzoquinol methylase UbiE [Gammaproteobacteria bacterium]|nr:bifunctional demethylmenaquinone methyltransferase/2-methoxy-6-polyprenyl-1,4-benzoquinol methylase UbiE [Gammaproteobacteria bacterium]
MDFGFEDVPASEKAARVAAVFSSVAPRYDLMNDLMSFGAHRLWKRFAVALANVRPGHRVLDLAAGTGDLAVLLARRVGARGCVVMADINADMLGLGRRRLLDQGIVGTVRYVQSDAESLPFPDDHFDVVTIAFGLRNVTDKGRALASIHRVLRPGGQLLVLEFSRLRLKWLEPLYRAYSFNVLPRIGGAVAGDAASYRYLAESISRHPGQEELLAMLGRAGFERASCHNLSFGVVALHRGYKL